MKIAFINISLRPEAKKKFLPVGLAYIITAVKRAGFDFDLIDMDIDSIDIPELEKRLIDSAYDVVAFGCIVTGFKFAKKIAEIVKKANAEAIVIAGNSVATSIPDILLENTRVDILVMGEGDITIVELLQTMERGGDLSAVKGIVFIKDGKIIKTAERSVIPNLDDIPFPDWGLFNLKKYNKYANVVNRFFSSDTLAYPLNMARGCPFNCTFCYHVFKNKRYRKYSEGAVIEEIKRLHYDYGVNYITFWDELTFHDIKSVRSMVSNIEKLPFRIGWDAEVRGNLFKNKDLELIKDMKASGCDNVFFALENANPEILAAINKKISVDDFVEQALVMWKGGVKPLTGVIFGYPQETPESIKLTFDVCEKSGIFPSIGFLLLLPGTYMYEWAKDNGYIADELAYLERAGDRQDLHINLTKIPDKELVSIVETEGRRLARKQGLELESVFKTTAYMVPKNTPGADE